MRAKDALNWANTLSRILAKAMGCAFIRVDIDTLMNFYVPARDLGENSHDNLILSGILRVGGMKTITTKDARKLRTRSTLDGSVLACVLKGVKMLTNDSVSEDSPNLLQECIDIVRGVIDSQKAEETADAEWTEAQDQKLLELEALLRGHSLVRQLLSVAFKGEWIVVSFYT